MCYSLWRTDSGDLEQLMRNKGLQARYDTWMMGMKVKYGSTGMCDPACQALHSLGWTVVILDCFS